MNHEVTFMSGGAKNLPDLQLCMRPNSEHVLDYFHIAMRITVMQQIARGLPPPHRPDMIEIITSLERVRRFLLQSNDSLLQSNDSRALELVADIEDTLFHILEPDGFVQPRPDPSAIPPQARKMHRHIRDFGGYISNNAGMIPNYAERRRYGEPVSTAFVESTVNQAVSKRFTKKQKMQWTPSGVISSSSSINALSTARLVPI